MLFDQNRVDAIIHNWKNQVFSNETIPGVPQRLSTCLKPPTGGFRNLASRSLSSFARDYLCCCCIGVGVFFQLKREGCKIINYNDCLVREELCFNQILKMKGHL